LNDSYDQTDYYPKINKYNTSLFNEANIMTFKAQILQNKWCTVSDMYCAPILVWYTPILIWRIF